MDTQDILDAAALSVEDRELFALLLEEEGVAFGEQEGIGPREDAARRPLSFAQERLWFLDHLEPGSPVYNISFAVRLAGDLNVAVLERALGEVVRRHEVLRASFPTVGGQAAQVVAPAGAFRLRFAELDAEDDAEESLRQLATEEARRPFDLATGPLVRVTLVRLGEREHAALFTVHHIVSDGWSSEILIGEVAALYEAFAQGRPSPLEELPIQYADFAAWQRDYLQGETLAEQLSYWKRQLAGSPAVLELPTDRPRPAAQSFRGASRSFEVSAETSEALRALARQEGATLFMTLLAAFKVLLHRYTNQTDIVVGTPVAGRRHVETEPLVGLFVNTLVLRSDLADRPTFRQLLARVRETTLGAEAHQDVPFERLVDELQPERDFSHTPLFQVVFNHQNAPREATPMPGLTLSLLEVDGGTSKFDLQLTTEEAGRALKGALVYNTDLFDAATAERMTRHFVALLEAAALAPDASVSELPFLTGDERAQLLEGFGGARQVFRRAECVHELFERQAAETPENVAVTSGDEHLTYAELNARANRLARRLRALGVGPDSLVALLLERSAGTVVALLGVMKAGGAYLPLDPAYPQERLEFMLEDSGARVLVTERALLDAAGSHAAAVVCLDDEHERALILAESAENLSNVTTADGLAYVIYTSGSTGKPKGVLMPHSQVTRLMAATQHWFDFGPQDVWTLFHSYAFDFSVWELWGALLYGGRLVVVPYLVSRSPEEFHSLLASERVTVLNQTPSAFRQLMRVDEGRSGAAVGAELALRYVVFGGEALEMSSLAGWFARHGDVRPRLVNMYGITETTVHVTYRPVGVADTSGGSVIGEPIPDLELYVLDANLEPSPVGVCGEMYVGGDGLARGYLNRPELTAQRFIPHPFSKTPGARLYKTGDLARRLADGDVEYLGRSDEQVKIRGFRIELGEIEAALASHESVGECAVVALDGAAGKRLVAYVVAAAGAEPRADELRAHLRTGLPEYMVPSAFVTLDALPLTTNGKLNRRLLPAPEQSRLATGQTYVAPSNETEEALAAVWSEVLGVARVGVNDNFFALGGDSIRSIQILARCKERGLEVSLQQLFTHQTVAELSKQLTGAAPETRARTKPFDLVAEDERHKLPSDVEDAYPLTAMQAGMLFHMDLNPDSPAYHNVDSIYLRAPFDEEKFRRAVAYVVARHAMLRTSFDLRSFREPLQIVHREAVLPVGVEDITHLSADEQERAVDDFIRREETNLFDLSRPPLLRFYIHRRSADTFQFTLTENHAIFDGWSLHATLAEVFEVYFRVMDGEELPGPPEVSVTYRDFVRLEQEALASDECRRFWEEKLADFTPLILPRRPAERRRREGARLPSVRVPVSPELSGALKESARRAGVPLKTVLLAAHLKVMSILTGQTDIVTGMATHGRPEEADGEVARGLFLNTLAFRMDVSASTWAELARRTFAAECELLPHRRYPFAAVQQGRDGGPMFEAMFNFIQFHVIDGVLQSGNLEVLDFKKAESTNFPLLVTFNLTEVTSQLGLEINYNPEELSDEQVESIGGYFARALAAMAEDADARHDLQSFLSEDERRRVLVEWNDTKSLYERDTCVHELFEQRAAETPGSVALVFGDEQVTYGELNARSNRLARHLRALGVGADSLVALCAERSVEMVVGLLAVLKAGGAYVPLDAAYPPERLTFMLEDTNARVLLTQARLAPRLPAHDAEVVLLDDDQTRFADESAENLPNTNSTDALAYVIYTSGSTGRPKGVAVPHRAVARLVRNTNFATFTPEEVFLQFAPVSFDASTLELWGALLNGARLALMPPGVPSLEELGRALRRHNVTTLWLTAGLFHLMVDERAEDLGGLRQLLAGGDVLSPEHVRRFLEAAPASTLINGYGPTENTTFTCCHPMRGSFDATRSVPLGRPVANTSVYVLDRRMRPVVLGSVGELYTGGDGLARGYLNRPELTAERFVPDPFSTEPGARLYRTGDLVRWLPDGTLEFLGRADHQVKIRGFRIELGEIEAALARHESVREASVVALDGAGGGKRLVAYVVGSEPQPAAAELRDFLTARLPEYMVPSAFVALDALPLTPNGKVDRKRLPAPDERGDEREGPFVAARTPVEEMLASVWSEVLGVELVGASDDFFALGGQSLLATQMVSRVRELFRVELPLRAVFEAPTLAQLAARVADLQRTSAGSVTPPVTRVARDSELPLSYPQQRLWFLDQLEPDSPFYNVPTAVRMTGRLDAAALEESLREVVRRHESLRTSFAVVEGRPVQVINEDAPVSLPVIDISHLSFDEREREARRLAREESRRPFSLTCAPLMRAVLVRLSEDEHVIVLTMHHIVSDGWSMEVLVREMSALYEAFSEGKPSPLAELPIQYADFAAWQRNWLQGEVLEAHLDYWKKRLAGTSGVLELRTDRPRPAAQTFRGAMRRFELPADLSEQINDFSRRENVTPFMTMLAAFNVLLRRESGQDDIVVGCNIANRNRGETESLIGFFVNMLPVRSDLSGQPTFGELLRRTREAAFGAYAHQDLPFDKLVAEVLPERDPSRMPLVQVVFNFQNGATAAPRVAGLALDFLDTGSPSATFDMTMHVENTPQGVRGELLYSTDLFDEATVLRLLEDYELILRGACASADARLGDLTRACDEADSRRKQQRQEAFQRTKRSALKNVRPKPVSGAK